MRRSELKRNHNWSLRIAHRWKHSFSSHVNKVNLLFNSLPTHHKKMVAILSGLLIALSCLLAVADGFLSSSSITLPQTISQPLKENKAGTDTKFKGSITTSLIPVGSMISIDQHAHTAFEIAMDHQGSLLILTVDSTSHETNKYQWRAIKLEELQKLEEKYRFVPIYQTSTEISK